MWYVNIRKDLLLSNSQCFPSSKPPQDPLTSPTLALSQTPSTFCDFSLMLAKVSSIDINWFFSFDQRMRKNLGPFRYFVYPFITRKKREVFFKVKYADRSHLYDDQEVCRADCQRCDHFHAPSATSPLPPQEWKEKTIFSKKGPCILPSPIRYRYQPSFGMFPYIHTGDGLVQMITLNVDVAYLLKWLLHKTGNIDSFSKWRSRTLMKYEYSERQNYKKKKKRKP